MGNLVPLAGALFATLVAAGLGLGIWSLIVGVSVGIPLISRYGFWENRQIREELESRFPHGGELVGFVYDRSADFLDAHAEVGLLYLPPGCIVLCTEHRTLRLPLNDKTAFGRKFNIHAAVGLGGWISIENAGHRPLLIESRAKDTMFAAKRCTNDLFERLSKAKGGPEGPPF